MAFQLALFSLFFTTILFSSSHAYRFNVGGKDGWVSNPSENYNQWSSRLRFLVSDTLFFKYNKGTDSVLVVSKDDYDNCNTDKPIMKMEDGDSVFTLDRPGPFYFISGNKGNCEKGQKLKVVVLSPRTRSPPTAGAPPPTPTGATPPTTGATPPTTGAQPPPAGAMPPTTGATPPPGGVMPPTTGAVPPSSGAIPPSGRAMSPTAGAVPPAAGVSPTAPTPGMAPTLAGDSPVSSSPGPSMSLSPGMSPGSTVSSPSSSGGAVSPSPEGSAASDSNGAPPPGSHASPRITPSVFLVSSISFMLSLAIGSLITTH